MKANKSLDHVMMSFVDNHLYCMHCGEIFRLGLTLPASINIVSAVSKTFGKEHRRCKRSERGDLVKAEHDARWELIRK